MASQFFNNSVFWIETDKIFPNPFQPRKEFDQDRLRDLAESIKMYGILQPLVVTRKERTTDEGGLAVEYELISGERRLRASKLAGLTSVPALIRAGEDSDREKLELAIIENLQREDLNVVDRAKAFDRLAKEFGFKHHEIGLKVGKSRVYVSNTLRILALPEEILEGLSNGKVSEGHTRPLLMLADRPAEQLTMYKEIVLKKMTVREAERLSRKIAFDRVRKKEYLQDPEVAELEEKFQEALGTRVSIERKENGGKILIDFFSNDDLRLILDVLSKRAASDPNEMLKRYAAKLEEGKKISEATDPALAPKAQVAAEAVVASVQDLPVAPIDDRSPEQKEAEDEDDDIYSVKNFSI